MGTRLLKLTGESLADFLLNAPLNRYYPWFPPDARLVNCWVDQTDRSTNLLFDSVYWKGDKEELKIVSEKRDMRELFVRIEEI